VRRELLISGVLALVCHGVFLFGLRLESHPPSLVVIPEVLDVRLVAGPPSESPQASGLVETTPEPIPIEPTPLPEPVSPLPEPTPQANRTESLPTRPRESSVRPPVSSVAKSGGGSSTLGNPQLLTGGGAGNTKPRYRLNPQPIYPSESRQLHHEGRVLLDVDVSADGYPTSVEIKQGSGFPALDAAAQTAVRRWTFEPARQGGIPVRARVEVPVQFNLRRVVKP